MCPWPRSQPAVVPRVTHGVLLCSAAGAGTPARYSSSCSPVGSHLPGVAVVHNRTTRGICNVTAIKTVHLKVALKKGEDAQSFPFLGSWTASRTLPHLESRQLALANVSIFVAGEAVACEDLLVGVPVFQGLQVGPRTLEGNRAILDGFNCSHVGSPMIGDRVGTVSLMMIARLNGVRDDTDTSYIVTQPADRPRVNFNTARTEPDPSLLDPIDSEQHIDIRTEVEAMKTTVCVNGLRTEHRKALEELMEEQADVFRTTFSTGPPASKHPLKISLTPNDEPVKVRPRNYSREKREVLSDLVENMAREGMAFSDPTSPWAYAPLVVPKPGPARYRFTIDVRPINKFTVKHQIPMPSFEHELTRQSGSRYFTTFDLSHGYWQLELELESRHLQYFITTDGTYSPNRVLRGTKNPIRHLRFALA